MKEKMNLEKENEKLKELLKHPFLRIRYIAHPFMGGSSMNSSAVMMHKKLNKKHKESFNEYQVKALKKALRDFAIKILDVVDEEDYGI